MLQTGSEDEGEGSSKLPQQLEKETTMKAHLSL